MYVKIDHTKVKGDLVRKIEEISGVDVNRCYQCGKCSAGCPGAPFMDLLPSQVMHLLMTGRVDRVLESNTHWMCASCFTCTVRCPKDIDLAGVMEAIRQIELRERKDFVRVDKLPERLNAPTIAMVSAFRKLTS
ncbi:heterodisulfide reductase [bacterium]|nr:MAG: heterodisulfide reductase [bacterium]